METILQTLERVLLEDMRDGYLLDEAFERIVPRVAKDLDRPLSDELLKEIVIVVEAESPEVIGRRIIAALTPEEKRGIGAMEFASDMCRAFGGVVPSREERVLMMESIKKGESFDQVFPKLKTLWDARKGAA